MNLVDQIKADEGWHPYVYDDATGAYIRPGARVVGNPTIGYGTLLSSPGGISDDEGETLLQHRITAAQRQAACLTVYAQLDPARQDVLTQMVFQMGLDGVEQFAHTLACLSAGDWAGAAEGMRNSLWAKQTPARANRLAQVIETGVAQ